MKKIMLVISLFILFLPSICNGEEVGESSTESSFDSSTDLTSRYSRKQILNGKTTNSEKKKGEIYLVFPFANSPYQSFSQFVLNGPTTVYSGFIETIYYREKIKIRDMYYENNPVKTDKVGIYSTDLCFTSEEGVIYHYKNVPYLVSSNQPTIFFSEVNFDKKNNQVSGEIKMPASKNTYQIELFYTDNDEYHYQEVTANQKGSFIIELNRTAIEGKMYLRASDGFGNYADACDILNEGKTSYNITMDALNTINNTYKVTKSKEGFLGLLTRIFIRTLGVIIVILTLLRLRVVIKRRRRRLKYK
ncbi:hypothetical protein DOK67_0001731 [Enterococcus sp. DIV0212c]|uniref:hypothetical protein n=1 Tax=Enterococcus sp. DIV0212c TaxID=2230867 RepID=UPI001A9B7FF5|nr:hypothetical protein [Enterococcus sp. DIV0212c]MBO1353869.1 hypothetical protein [Enterococcus sp. DIV0212c]